MSRKYPLDLAQIFIAISNEAARWFKYTYWLVLRITYIIESFQMAF